MVSWKYLICGSRWELRLREKGGKQHLIPCHHALAETLHSYIAAAGIAEESKSWLFRTSKGLNASVLSQEPMNQADAGVWCADGR